MHNNKQILIGFQTPSLMHIYMKDLVYRLQKKGVNIKQPYSFHRGSFCTDSFDVITCITTNRRSWQHRRVDVAFGLREDMEVEVTMDHTALGLGIGDVYNYIVGIETINKANTVYITSSRSDIVNSMIYDTMAKIDSTMDRYDSGYHVDRFELDSDILEEVENE